MRLANAVDPFVLPFTLDAWNGDRSGVLVALATKKGALIAALRSRNISFLLFVAGSAPLSGFAWAFKFLLSKPVEASRSKLLSQKLR